METRVARTRVRIKGTSDYLPVFDGPAGGASMSSTVTVASDGGAAPPPYHAGAGGYRAAGWWPSSLGPNAASASLPTIRARSAQEDRNNPLAGGALDTIAANIVGAGIKPQSQCPDRETREAINAWFADWTDESDADGAFDFYGQQWQAARTAAALGESFARFRVRRPGDMQTVPLQIQLLEPDFVPLNWSMPVAERGVLIQDGVETNGFGRKSAFWMYRYHPGDASVAGQAMEIGPVRVPASEVTQIFLPLRHGQRRGVPWLSRGLAGLRDDADYLDAERVRKKSAALFSAFIKSLDGDGPLSADAGESYATLEPATVQRLRANEDIVFAQPAESGATFEPFLKVSRRDLAVSAGLLYQQLTGDWSEGNDRTLRAAMNEFRRKCGIWQHHMLIFQFCRAVWTRWMMLAELSGRIVRPAGMSDLDFHRVQHVPEPWPYIQPVQDRQARDMDVRGGYASRDEKIAQTGRDPEVVDREIAAGHARADGYGLVYDTDPRKTSRAGLTQARASGAELPDTSGGADADDEEDPA